MEILLANPRGFCAGVDRAVEIVEHALQIYGAPVYVRHEIVHNQHVVNALRQKGAVFVEELSEVPDHGIVIFSAHGVSRAVREDAARRRLRVFDATCPLVTKVHLEVGHCQKEGRECVLIGHAGHPEVEGTLGQYRGREGEGGMYLVESVRDIASLQVRNPDFLSYVTQTTLSVDDTAEIIAALRCKFPRIVGPKKDDICYATQNRQDAVKELARHCDLILVVGSRNSSNSTRLMETAQHAGGCAFLIDNAGQIDPQWLHGRKTVGLTAGASAPESLVQEVVQRLQREWKATVREIPGKQEWVTFVLPRALRLARDDGTAGSVRP